MQHTLTTALSKPRIASILGSTVYTVSRPTNPAKNSRLTYTAKLHSELRRQQTGTHFWRDTVVYFFALFSAVNFYFNTPRHS